MLEYVYTFQGITKCISVFYEVKDNLCNPLYPFKICDYFLRIISS